MNNTKTALIIYPHQLFEVRYLPAVDTVYVVEEPLFFGTDQEKTRAFHKQKLVLHRASMRRYVEEELWPNDINVEYIELHEISHTSDILQIAQKAGINMVQIFDPADITIERRLHDALDSVIESPFELKVLPSPSFLLRRTEIEDFFADKTSNDFDHFYQWQRERFNILIDKKYKPVGGKWQYQSEPSALPLGHVPPGFASFSSNKYVEEAIKWVNKRFAANPGGVDDFMWPTNHAEATILLNGFIKDRLINFAKYQYALDGQAMLLYHSGLAGALNCGLINPEQVINAVLSAQSRSKAQIATVESFVRQIIGYREYTRALYLIGATKMHDLINAQPATGLAGQWYDGTTGLPPVDDVIRKANSHCYAHPAEKQMVVGNIMILCGIPPPDIYDWFMTQLIDSYDWAVLPAVFGLSQLNNLGGMLNKPPVLASSSILKLSSYEKDAWCDIWDGLYWGFVEANKEKLAKNPLTISLPRSLNKLNADHKRIIGYRAKDFLDSIS